MKLKWSALSNGRGVSTVELVIILAALVSVAVMLRGSLNGFTDRAVAAEFNTKKSAEIMTFGGDIKEGGGRGGMLQARPERGSGFRDFIDNTIVSPLRNLISGGRSEPVSIAIASDSSSRSPALLNAVLDQFYVETAKRYQPTFISTYCNIFAWDATRAMNAEIPHWINRKTKASYAYNPALSYAENAEIAYEANVNLLYDWMERNAESIGYREVSEQEAKMAANRGQPAVAIWKNPKEKSSGHIVILRPYDTNREGDPELIYVAQAGRKTSNYIAIEKVFNSNMRTSLKFYTHD